MNLLVPWTHLMISLFTRPASRGYEWLSMSSWLNRRLLTHAANVDVCMGCGYISCQQVCRVFLIKLVADPLWALRSH